jgi:hypothetical protein
MSPFIEWLLLEHLVGHKVKLLKEQKMLSRSLYGTILEVSPLNR